ncbi:conserved protein of unknown function [Nitrosotalea devaniterrae]|uniref:Roadblock/LAMTOR2 domain-containing protein n=1 Tax=Nitrosotalea devaniterrae TaxID=1078905 RepID=A0A128A3F9_9ARCH|nr:conserved protein of unknown function [Candidatus Nitrosotalea devanaterra]
MQKTPSQKWTEQITQHRKKCQSILELSKSIRYVGLVNEYGRTLTGVFRPGLATLLSDEPARNEFFLVSTMLAMRNKASSALGNMDSAIINHNKVTLIIFQRKEGIYYISVNKSATPNVINQIIAKIKKII